MKSKVIVNNIFTTEEISTLSAEIDRQLQELSKSSLWDLKSFGTEENEELPAKQKQVNRPDSDQVN